MDESESSGTAGSSHDKTRPLATASVSVSGDLTIPDQVCEKLELSPPGLVAFYESDSGDILMKRVPSPSEMSGIVARNAEDTRDAPATELLRSWRDAERLDRE
jgi:bifunctional DNA-binding transcriptional regulator/antitoxin component of YhaV-PrlF toxin-antitoxin module